MITQRQAEDLYEKLSTLTNVITPSDQVGLYCEHWLKLVDKISGHKLCDRTCPMALNNGGCALDEARRLVAELER